MEGPLAPAERQGQLVEREPRQAREVPEGPSRRGRRGVLVRREEPLDRCQPAQRRLPEPQGERARPCRRKAERA